MRPLALVLTVWMLAACSNGAVALETGDGGDGVIDTGSTLPACDDPLSHGTSSFGPVASGPFVTLVATGAVSYTLADGIDTPPVDVDATLARVDPVAGTIVLTTDAGDANVTLTNVDRLDALTVGLRVHAHFEHGLVLTDLVTGRPLLAALTIMGTGTRSVTVDVGPIHLVAGAAECHWVWSSSGCDVGVERTSIDATGAARPTSDQLVVDGHAYWLRVLQSLRQSRIPAGCGILLYTTFSIVVVAQPS